jgi:hypothetical protein
MQFKTPSRFMAGMITLGMMFLFSAVLLAPLYNPAAKFDEALKQTLLAIVMICVGFYLGGSKESSDKNDTIAAQANAAASIAAVAAGTPSTGGATSALATAAPTGTPSDPVSVTEVKP